MSDAKSGPVLALSGVRNTPFIGPIGQARCQPSQSKSIYFQSSVCEKIMEQLGQNEVAEDQKQVHIVSMESFYRRLTDEQRQAALRGKYNFDHPGKHL